MESTASSPPCPEFEVPCSQVTPVLYENFLYLGENLVSSALLQVEDGHVTESRPGAGMEVHGLLGRGGGFSVAALGLALWDWEEVL